MKTAHRPSGPGSDIRNTNIPVPPGLDVSNISRRDSSIDDDEDEEEMVSLGLSRDGSLQLATDSHDDSLDGDGGSQNQNNNNNNNSNNNPNQPNISLMVGTNRKSAFPATPATPATTVNNNRMSSLQQRAAYGGGAPIRRTPGPGGLSVAHQARHRRTPGAGAQEQHTEADLNRMHARTPVMSGGGSRLGKTPHKTPLVSSSLVTPSNKSNNYTTETPNLNKHSNNNNMYQQQQQQQQPHQRQLYTPAHFVLAKNADLHMENRPDAFSPATIRMTDSLEKIMADDDDYFEAKQKMVQQAQQQQIHKQVMTPNRKFIPNNNNYDAYPETQDTYHASTRDDIGISAGRGAFRRIQSTGSNSDDEEMDEMKDLTAVSSDIGDDLSQDDAELSLIIDDEDEEGDIPKASDTSTTMSRPKPLSFKSDGGSSGGAFKPAKRVVPTTTPRPQRTVPRHTGGPTYQAAGGHQGGMYYPQQQGYFGQHHHHQHPAPNMFNQQPHPSHHQYHSPHQYPQPPPQHHLHHQQPPHFHLPSIPSPQFQPPHPSGVVSPLTIPDYSQGPYHPQANVGHWRSGGFAPGMPQGPHGQHPQGSMGMMPMPGHASPDLFHEMSGAASPFTLPHHPSYPASPSQGHYPPHGNNYSHQGQHQPGMHYQSSGPPGAARPRTKSKENQGNQGPLSHYNRSRASPSPASFSPTKYQSSPTRGKDAASSINSGFSGLDERPQGSSFNNPSVSSPNSSSAAASLLRNALPGLNTSGSAEGDNNDWFYNPSSQKSNMSYSTIDSVGSTHSKKSSLAAAATGRTYQQQQQPLSTKQRSAPPNVDTKSSLSSFPFHNRPTATAKQLQRDDFVIESPTERQAFKEFGKKFRAKENESLAAAREFALASLSESNRDIFLPPATHWRVYLELADVAKRCNEIEESRRNYRKCTSLQPRASQGWLEHSKLEEESGNIHQCAAILQEGLEHCSTNENLLIRSVKFYERVGCLEKARHLLSRLKYMSVDKSWKTMLEGALLEARAGRYRMAREVLKFLTHEVPWYGPLYLAHTKLENDYGSATEAFSIVEKGLKELPRYGPLYFQAFRLLEKDDLTNKAYDLPRTMQIVARADNISRELLWKVHLEAAQIQERAAVLAVEDSLKSTPKKKLDMKVALQATRRSYAKAIMLCPANLSWKIWLAAGRTEVSCGNTRGARELFLRAHDSVSEKGRSTVILECARLEEYCGDLSLSRSLLCKARQQFGKSDWKVWLASVNLECRCGLQDRAIAFAQEALNLHRGTGRLWAALIQLRHDEGELFQMKVLKCALRAVPKSGEVWCEGARIYLNPFSPTFDMQSASRHLSFAARFTPQYGDSFLEQLRLNMIDQWLIPLATPFINGMYEEFLSSEQMGIKDAYKFIAENTNKAADVMKTQLKEEDEPVTKDVLDTSELELRCSSADPNYGHLWFNYRGSSIDTAREVIRRANGPMADSVNNYSYLYIAAMVRRAGVLMLIKHHQKITPTTTDQSDKLELPSEGLPNPNSRSWDIVVDKQLRLAPSLDEMISESAEGSKLFTGCVESNDNWDKKSSAEKRRILFGSDSLLS